MRKVAIIAASFRMPGTTQASFWDDLLAGRDLVTQVDSSRWSPTVYFHPDRTHPGSSYTFAAGSIGDVASFDANFFGISPREAALMDPQQRLLLEMGWEVFENAGIRPSSVRGTPCGVYIGISSTDYSWRMADDLAAIDASFATGNTSSIAANRLSYFYDLRGPSMAIDTACSSSLTAFHQAHRSIATGEASHALTGAISLHLHPLGFVSFSKASMLSKSGRCRVFDEAADGYVRSEGGGLFLLKDYECAVADGNPILAVVAHSAANTDGHKSGITVPSVAAQAALLTGAYQLAGIKPAEIDYIEAHGTGTAVGDPVEARSLAEALAKHRAKTSPLPIGSVKGNVGHLEAASGIAGLVKALYCLRHRMIPAHVGMETPNPRIPFSEWNLEVVTTNRPLQTHGKVVIGVNSFGFGGANAHVILESHVAEAVATPVLPKARAVPIVVSGRTPEALRMTARQLAEFIAGQPQKALYDIAYQLAHGRDRHAYGALLFGRTPNSIATLLTQFADDPSDAPGVVSGTPVSLPVGAAFIYSGNGVQWAGMGAQLLADPTFRTAVRGVDALFSRYADYSLEAELAGDNGANRYERTEIAQPALFALQVGITEMLRRRGLKPVAVTGHSVGEVAAAWAAGALSLAAAVSVIHHRSVLQGTTKGAGRMTAVRVGEARARELLSELALADVLCLAGVNSGHGVTIAGPTEALDLLEANLRSRGIVHLRLDLDYAFHSAAMDGLFPELRRALAHLEPEDTTVPLYSTVTGEIISGKALNAEYWWRNIREPVLFERAIGSMLREGINIYVEIGPHAPLCRYIQDCLDAARMTGRVISTGKRGDDSPHRIHAAAGQALIAGATMDWECLLPWQGNYVRLPNYPWQREKFWHPVTSAALGLIGRRSEHPLLGYALDQAALTWENDLDTHKYPLFADHVVGGATVFPGTGYVELALAAAFRWQPTDCAEIEDLEILAPLLLGAEPSRTIRCALEADDGRLTIRSREHLSCESWAVQAMGRILREPSTRRTRCELGELPTRQPDFTAHSHKLLTLAAGLEYGPRFQTISHGWVIDDCALAVFELDSCGADLEHYYLHPALLDGAFQLIIQLMRDCAAEYDGMTFVPTRVEHMLCFGDRRKPKYARARLLRRAPHSICAQYEIYDENRKPIAVLDEVRLHSARLQRSAMEHVRHFEYVAVPCSALSAAAGSDTLLETGLRNCFTNPQVQRTHRLYAQEVEPLLDVLCSRFLAEALTSLPSSAVPKGAPWIAAFREAQVKNVVAPECGHKEDDDFYSAQAIWNTLIGDYPDFFPLVHAVGCIGMHLTQLLAEQRTLAEILPRDASYLLLQQRVLGLNAKVRVVAALRAQVEACLRKLPEGERFGILELGASAPTLASDLCPSLHFDQVDYRFMSSQPAALEEARRLQEQYPALAVAAFGEESGAQRACAIAIVTFDFGTLRDSMQALETARRCLAPGGALLVLGQHPSRAFDFVYGGDPSWWSESSQGLQSCQQTADFWQQYLQQAGFGRVRRFEHAATTPCGAYALLAVLETAATDNAVVTPPTKHWMLLVDEIGYAAHLAASLSAQLQAAGDSVSCTVHREAAAIASALTDAATRDGPLFGIVHLGGLARTHEANARKLLDVQVERCATAAALVQACESTGTTAKCFFITANAACHLLPNRDLDETRAAAGVADAALAGFARTLMNEAGVAAVHLIDLEVSGTAIHEATTRALACELRAAETEQEMILTAAGARYAPRLRATAAPQASVGRSGPPTNTRHALGFTAPGQLRNLRWEIVPRSALRGDQVEVAVEATGLNFRDIMYALGLLSDEGVERGFAGASLGLEFAGIVADIGPQVTDFAIGDAVVGFGPSSFGNRVVTQTSALAHLPTGLSFPAAATIPSTFFTAYYSLHTLAALREGENVLIHGAAGGVGMAAIQVAKWCGAEIYATAGSEEKRDFLCLLGVDHVFDSRSPAFADQILEATNGAGVDVVLNSLAGEAINRNLRVLKPFGRFVELGKRDFYENTRIGLRPFRNNLSYFGVDADQLMGERVELAKRVFAEVLQHFRDRVFHALPYQAFEARDVIDAFRHMQQARHIGKIVVTYGNGIPEPTPSFSGTPQRLHIDADSTVLVTGGLRGFGLRTAEWLADRGARQLVLVGRSGAVAEEAQPVVARLERRGVNVVACVCDVTDREALVAILERVARELPPLRGVVHAASLIDDGLIRSMSATQIRNVMAPKVSGALHLHELTRHLSLDFFVLYSSATTLFGNPGQSNYVAANATLEALSRSRRAAGLPATCVRWGAIDDVGFLARSPKLKQTMLNRMGGQALPSSVALDVLEAMLLSDRSDLGVLELDWRVMRRFLPSAAASKFIEVARDVCGDAEEEGGVDLGRLLQELPTEELHSTVVDLLKREIAAILRIGPEKIDAMRPVQEMGFDSLMGVELVVAVENRFGVRLPVLALSDGPTVVKLASLVIKQLRSDETGAKIDRSDITRAQVEQIAGQHAVDVPGADEIERIKYELHRGESGLTRRMIH